MALDLTQLRYFHTVSRQGSMSRAARALRVSQPTLTVAIRNLETALRTTLFFRDSKGVTLTQTGRELLERTQDVLEQLEEAEASVHVLEKGERGRFVIGCHASLGGYYLPGFLGAHFSSPHEVELQLRNDSSASVWQAVVARDVHFGIVVNARPHPDLVLVPIYRDRVEILIAGRAGATRSRALAEGELRRGPLVYADRIDQCREVVRQLTVAGLLPTRLLTCGDLELVKSLALSGIGPAILPRRVAHYGHPGGLMPLHPSLPTVEDTIHLVYRADLHRTRAALDLKDALVVHGRTLESPSVVLERPRPRSRTRADRTRG